MPKGASARDIAFEVALAVENDGAFANLALPRALAESSLDTRDRAFATHLVYGALRAQGELDAVIEEVTQRPAHSLDSDVRVLLRLGCFQLLRMRVESHAAVDETVRVAKSRQLHRVTGLVNAALRAVSAHSGEYWDRVIGQSTTSLHSHPSWIAAKIDAALAECDGGGELEQALTSHNEAPRVTLCHLPGFSSPDKEHATAFSPCGEVLEGGDPTALPGVNRHHIRVQDEGSQLAALTLSRAAPWHEGERVWDMCSGPGGKTALLGAEACASGATVLATELTAHRASLVEDSITAVSSRFPGLIRVETDDSTKPREETFSRILLDAPCSGLGALRRRPEARWTKKPESLPGLVELQRALLRNGLSSLAPGGVLAYVTCAPVVEETTEVVTVVLAESEEFSALDTPTIMGSVARTTLEGHRRGSAAQLWTHRHGTDAMFVQLIRRDH